MRCPKCGAGIDTKSWEPRQLVICPVCGVRLRLKTSLSNEQQLKLLIGEIAQAFPDGTVDMTRWNHEKWDDRIALFCSQLGYSNVGAFLQAYGFRVRFENQQECRHRRKGTIPLVVTVITVIMVVSVGIFAFRHLSPETEETITSDSSQIQMFEYPQMNDSITQPQKPHSSSTVPNDKKYKRVFDAYDDACSIGVEAYRENSWSQSRPTPYFPNCVDAIAYGYYESGYPLYYAYYDLNEDGTDELFIGQDNGQIITLLDVYSYDGSAPVKLFPDIQFGSRSNLAITSSHELVTSGSSGADNPSAEYYSLPTGSCQPQFLLGYCAFNHAEEYPGYTPVDISCWFDYVETTGIHSEFSWSAL